MRLLLIGGVSALLAAPLMAQPAHGPWRAGIVAFGGPGLLLGAELSRRLPRLGTPEFAIEATVLTHFYRASTLACQNSGCTNAPPTFATRQGVLSLAASMPLGARFAAVGSAGIAVTHWDKTAGPAGPQSHWTLGLGRTLGRRGSRLELRAVQLAPGANAERGVRVSWHRAW